MAFVNFYRGVREKYSQVTHSDGIYFSTNTAEILLNGLSYGGGITSIVFSNGKLTFTFTNGKTLEVVISEATASASGLMSSEDKIKLDALPDSEELLDEIASAITSIVKDENASHITLTSEVKDDGHTEYTIGESNIASASDLTAEIARATEAEEGLAESIYYYHATATISANKTLIEKGVDTSVTLTAKSSFKTEGANTLDIKNNTSGETLASTGTTLQKTATVSISDTTVFQAVAAFDYNVSKTANVTVTAKYPIFTLGSASDVMDDASITGGTKAVKSSAAGSYNVTLSQNLMYFWICVPSDMTVNKVTLSGFDVPMQAYQTVAVTGKGNYKCYRSTNTNDAGTYTLVVS